MIGWTTYLLYLEGGRATEAVMNACLYLKYKGRCGNNGIGLSPWR